MRRVRRVPMIHLAAKTFSFNAVGILHDITGNAMEVKGISFEWMERMERG